jgi:hypothetical protein
MSYATQSTLHLWIQDKELTRLTEGGVEPASDIVTAALAEASSRIDVVLAQLGISVPLASPSLYIQNLEARLSLQALSGRMTGGKPPERLDAIWKAALEELDQIAKGERTIAGDTSGGMDVENYEESSVYYGTSLW